MKMSGYGILWCCGCLMMSGLIGCNTAGEGGKTGRSLSGNATVSINSLESANADYLAGRYEAAFVTAAKIQSQQRKHSAAGEQAGYLAGLSAYQLKNYREAERYLEPLTASSSGQIAGHSSATLGLIDREAGRDAEAIVNFKSAYRRLLGKEKAEAAFQCGLMYQQLGQTSAARRQFLLARAASKDPRFRKTVDGFVSGTGWTIQIGAFATLVNAEARVREYNGMSARRALGEARIYEEVKGRTGQRLYVVQVGNFFSHDLAERSRGKIHGPALVTTVDPGVMRASGEQFAGVGEVGG